MRERAAASADGIPTDALFDALLQLPVKGLCRIRAVCRPWRGLISDPVFIAAHGARHPGPLFLAKFQDDKTSIYVVDLSGGVVKRIAGAGSGPYHQLLCTRLDLACVATDWNRCSVVNPATGAVHVLPETSAPEHWNRVNQSNPYTLFALGRVAATGEHKVLRMFNRLGYRNGGQQVFEVFTVSSGGDGHARRWRGHQGPGLFIDECNGTVVNGVVYFLTYSDYDGSHHGIRPDYILSFDLGVEEWRRDLRGPISSNAGDDEVLIFNRRQLALAELNDYLVLAYHNQQPRTVDLWFLVDFGSGLWMKQYHMLTYMLKPSGLN
ncbi:F-box protein At3g07870-like [Setaria viridis]|uniref:F-box protein At3g07870-like n=1 Tax=Setaria viridis TaxID=4556 RepID=UPI003B3A7849